MSRWNIHHASFHNALKVTLLCVLCFVSCVTLHAYPSCLDEACWEQYNKKHRAWLRQREAQSASSLTVEPEAEPLRRAFLDWLASFKSLACEYTFESWPHLWNEPPYASQIIYRFRGPLEKRDFFYSANPNYAPDKDGYSVSTLSTTSTRRVSRTDYYSADHQLVNIRASLNSDEEMQPTRGRASPDTLFDGTACFPEERWLAEFFSVGHTYMFSELGGPVLVHTRAPNGNECIRIYFNAENFPSSYVFGRDAGLTPPELKRLGHDPSAVFAMCNEVYFDNYTEQNGVRFPLSIVTFSYRYIPMEDEKVLEADVALCEQVCAADAPSFEEFSFLFFNNVQATTSRVLAHERRVAIKPETLRINEVLPDSEFEVVIPEGAEVDGGNVPSTEVPERSIAWYPQRLVFWVMLGTVVVLLVIGLGAYGLYRRYLGRM